MKMIGWLVNTARTDIIMSTHNLTSPTEEEVRQNSMLQIIPVYATRIDLRAPLGRGE